MNTLYISDSSKVLIDENDNVLSCISEREAIRSIYLLKEPTKIVYSKRINKLDAAPIYKTNTIYGDPGQLVIVFYENSFNHPIIIVNSEEWADNIRSYNNNLAKHAKNICDAYDEAISASCADNDGECDSNN